MTEKQLISQLQKGPEKEKAFRILIQRYQERLYWHIRKIVLTHEDANDIIQDCFIKIYKNIHSFRGDSSLYSWMYRMGTNESLNFLKRQAKERKVSYEEFLHDRAESLQEDILYDGDRIQLLLQKAIAKLPDKQRLVFNMRYFEELKYSEISEILEVSEGSLKASYHHAVAKIKDYFQKEDWTDKVLELKIDEL